MVVGLAGFLSGCLAPMSVLSFFKTSYLRDVCVLFVSFIVVLVHGKGMEARCLERMDFDGAC